jgi:glycine dehydrogenase
MVIDLTGMPIANASLLDEGTAAAEAMHLLFASRSASKKNAPRFFVDRNTFPQTIDVLRTRSGPIGVELVVDDVDALDLTDPSLFAIYVQNPGDDGALRDYTEILASAHAHDVFAVVGADLMSLILSKSPGEMGADVVVGTSQRFGVPMGFGGPHAAFFATRDAFKRQMPGRIIGASIDASGNPGYRMALQTREQHIRREKATSNICTAQVLLSVMAGMYAVYHGPDGLRKIAGRIHGLARKLEHDVSSLGVNQLNKYYFDTLRFAVPDQESVRQAAHARQVNFRYYENGDVGVALDEVCTLEDVDRIMEIFANGLNRKVTNASSKGHDVSWPQGLLRQS